MMECEKRATSLGIRTVRPSDRRLSCVLPTARDPGPSGVHPQCTPVPVRNDRAVPGRHLRNKPSTVAQCTVGHAVPPLRPRIMSICDVCPRACFGCRILVQDVPGLR
jgi:hypothetical protein